MLDGVVLASIFAALILAGLGVIYSFAILSGSEKRSPEKFPFRAFVTPLREKVSFHYFERRSQPRSEANDIVECRDLTRSLYSGSPFEAKMIDVSQGGCQILSNAEIPPTSLMYLKHPDQKKRHQLAFVAYSRCFGEGYQSGLEFLPQKNGFT